MGHFSLNSFLKHLAAGKIVLYTPVYSTFNRIPDKILNANQKLLLQGFMLFSQATKMLRQLGLIDNKFQLPISIIAALAGLTRFQAQRAIKQLPAAVKFINEKKILKFGEKLEFQIKDEDGKEIPENELNRSGVSYWYVFKYSTPRDKSEVKGTTDTTADVEKLETELPPKYDSGSDPYYQDKKKEFDKLYNFMPGTNFIELYSYSLDEIVKAVDYYFITLKEKQDIAKASGRDVEAVQLNYMWLKFCLLHKYYATKFTPRKKVQDEVERIKILIAKVRSFVTDEKIKIPFKVLHTDKPLHKYSDFENLPAFHKQLHEEWKKIPMDIQKEFYNLAGKYYRFEHKKDIAKRDPVVHDKAEAQTRLQQIITVAYLNFV